VAASTENMKAETRERAYQVSYLVIPIDRNYKLVGRGAIGNYHMQILDKRI
jgi:hypothetical protein